MEKNIYTEWWNQKVKWLSYSLQIWEETLYTSLKRYELLTRNGQKCKGFAVLIDLYTKKVEVHTTFQFCSDHIYIYQGLQYGLHTKFKKLSRIEIMCLKGFQTLTSGDPKWPLTSKKNNRDHLLTKGYLPTNFEVQVTCTSWDIVFTKFPHFFQTFTSSDIMFTRF